MRTTLIKTLEIDTRQNSQFKLLFATHCAKLEHFSTTSVNTNDEGSGKLPTQHLPPVQPCKNEEVRKLLEDVTRRQMVTKGLKTLKQPVTLEKPAQKWTSELAEITMDITKKTAQAATNLPTAIHHLIKNRQALSENGKTLLKKTMQSVEAKVSAQLSNIPDIGFMKPSTTEVETVLGVLNNTRDKLRTHIAKLKKNMMDDPEQNQLLLKELQKELLQIESHIHYITSHDFKAKNEKGMLNIFVTTLSVPAFYSVALVKKQMQQVWSGDPSNRSPQGISSIHKSSPQQDEGEDDIPESVCETCNPPLQQPQEEATNEPPSEGNVETEEEVVESYTAAIQRLAVEQLEHNIRDSVQKHINSLDVLREEVKGLGVDMDGEFAKCEEELQDLTSKYTDRTKQSLQDMSAALTRPITDVGNNLMQCSSNISELKQEIQDLTKESTSYIRLAALSVNTATTLMLVPMGLANIPMRMTRSLLLLPTDASKILLANGREADSRANEIVEELRKKVEECKETVDE